MSTNLPTLNYEFALNQLGGNEALLSKMLGRFVSEFSHVADDIAACIAKDDIKGAKMKVHTVKGISGNLGLQALFDCATRFDASLRTNDANQVIVNEFSRLIADTCVEIQKHEHKEGPQRNLQASTLLPDVSKVELINRLKRNEFIDDDTLDNLIAGLGLSGSAANSLLQAIEELQYQQAIAIVEKIPS